jgi:hypothetical protein
MQQRFFFLFLSLRLSHNTTRRFFKHLSTVIDTGDYDKLSKAIVHITASSGK